MYWANHELATRQFCCIDTAVAATLTTAFLSGEIKTTTCTHSAGL